jgi:hypothetical protein
LFVPGSVAIEVFSKSGLCCAITIIVASEHVGTHDNWISTWHTEEWLGRSSDSNGGDDDDLVEHLNTLNNYYL